ncbi:low molecular weight phosphotyrosine protein phosphatase [Paraburkholderia sp. Se-20369]|nr:low molecular weight phosphotyrosine protein phosphatase [Paraburkholderia sp. Se-20369]
MIKHILVVCEGNVCRSPIAQGLLQRALPGIVVVSAGVSAIDGVAIDPIADRMLKARGIDLSGHRSKRLDRQMCRDADLILAMELAQRRAVERLRPVAHGRVYRLAEALASDVPDPYRRALPRYDHATMLIEQGVRDWAARIVNLNGRGRPGHACPAAEGPRK